MGCSTCKGNSSKESDDTTIETMNLIPKSIQDGNWSGNIIFKITAFIILILVWPLITLAIFIMVFMKFFIPSKNPKELFGDMMEGIVMKYANFKIKRGVRKREKEFQKNRSYSGDSELLDIEVFGEEENNEDVVDEK